VTNNHAELTAVIMALESLPEGWAGTLYTDSENTVRWLNRRGRSPKVTPATRTRLVAALDRVGDFRKVLVAGHPTYADLDRGCREDGVPVSRFNVRCDELCRAVIANHLLSLRSE
jgi:ribonuclease HI